MGEIRDEWGIIVGEIRDEFEKVSSIASRPHGAWKNFYLYFTVI